MSTYRVTPWTPKPINGPVLARQLVAAGQPCNGAHLAPDRSWLELYFTGPFTVATVNSVVAAHTGDADVDREAFLAQIRLNETRIRAAAVNTILTALEGNSATNNQIQTALAKVIRYIRREAVS
jgi:hypothetical protein